MSERSEFPVNNEALLRNADVNDIQDESLRKIVLEIQALENMAKNEFKKYNALQNMLAALEQEEPQNLAKIEACRDERNACIKKRNELLAQSNALSNKRELQPLIAKLKSKAFREAELRGQAALNEYHNQIIEHQSRVAQKWAQTRQEVLVNQQAADQVAASNNQAGQKRAQKKLAKVEAEIAETRLRVDALFEEIEKLRWYWFGKKNVEKEKLKVELKCLQSKLLLLYQEETRLKNKLRK